jgi:hypothetical protein
MAFWTVYYNSFKTVLSVRKEGKNNQDKRYINLVSLKNSHIRFAWRHKNWSSIFHNIIRGTDKIFQKIVYLLVPRFSCSFFVMNHTKYTGFSRKMEQFEITLVKVKKKKKKKIIMCTYFFIIGENTKFALCSIKNSKVKIFIS